MLLIAFPKLEEYANLTHMMFSLRLTLTLHLIIQPQLIWRGSDFGYLPSLIRPRPIKPHGYKLHKDEQPNKASAVRALRENYAPLLPRWKGVVLTAEAELEAEQEAQRTENEDVLPWSNIKFTAGKGKHVQPDKFYLEGESVRKLTGDVEDQVVLYDETDIAEGGYTSLHELANYKYHIDLGGGGGTTWTGLIQKLAMPGVLFHHVTPTKDYLYDRLEAWRHYIPVSSDLSDLKSKVEWANANPDKAKWISDQGTAFMRDFVSQEGYGKIFQEDFVAPLGEAIKAYQPVANTHPGMDWMEVIKSVRGGEKMEPIAECSGHKTRGSCRPLGRANGGKHVPKQIQRKTIDTAALARAAVSDAERRANDRENRALRGRLGSLNDIVGGKSR